MPTIKVEPILSQDKEFIVRVTPFDFTNMGQYALEIEYTNGDTDMFTTKSSTNPNQFGTHEFETKEEMMNFYKKIKP